MKTDIYFLGLSRSVLLRMRNLSDKSYREDQNTHFMLRNIFSPENLAVYEIMLKNMERPNRSQMTMAHERWIFYT
jgi:hypothetical protein